MVTINIDDIQRDLVGYLHRVQAGETLLVLEADQPVAEIKPVRAFGPEFAVGVGEPRPFGLCAEEFDVPDDFAHVITKPCREAGLFLCGAVL